MIGEPAVESLIEALNDDNERVRLVALNAFGYIGDRRAVEPLIAILKSEDNSVKWEAENALSRIGL
ncbi:MAG: HEAT repeat domain-containing protein [Theionarchaea archaeon]|nr:HEAT repeat domain-containing protein [Theionarchaea archaeon]